MSNQYSSWVPGDICLVIIVCVLFLILSCCNTLKSLLFGVNSSRSQGNQAQRQLHDVSIPDDGSLQLQSYGLEFCVINSVPLFQFKKNEGEEKKTINADCAVCLGEFEEGEWLKHLPNCNHGFHVSCIDTWFQSHSNCPLCRSHVNHDLVANPDCSVSSHPLLETLRREDFSLERDAHFQSLRSEMLQILGH